MALVKQVLEQAILAAFEKQAAKSGESDDPAQSRKEIAADIATAVDSYIKTATVTTVVVGTSPSGPVSGTGTGNLT